MALIQLTEDQVKTWAELEQFHHHRAVTEAHCDNYEAAAFHAKMRQFISHVAEHSIAASQQGTVICGLCDGRGCL